MAETFYLRKDGMLSGPLTIAQLQALKTQGRLLPEDEISVDQIMWDKAGTNPMLFPAGGGAAPSAPGGTPGGAPSMVKLAEKKVAPPSRPPRRRKLPDDYEEEDDFEDRPRRAASSSSAGLVISIVLGVGVLLVLVIVVCLAAIAFIGIGTRPSATFSTVGGSLPVPGAAGGNNWRVTRMNYNQIRAGMTYFELTNLLGTPTKDETNNGVRTLTWESGIKEITVRLDPVTDRVKSAGGMADKTSFGLD
jgi:hypothetical protein